MDDDFLHGLRRDPSPEFARGLRERLADADVPRRRRPFLVPAFAAAACLAIVSLIAFPSVRASAQNFLDFFRMKKVTGIRFDEARMDAIHALTQNGMLPVEGEEVLRDPGPLRRFATPEDAAAAAEMPVRLPSFVPAGLAPDSLCVQGAAEVRMTVNTDRLRDLLDALDLKDVTIPDKLDGDWIQVKKPPIVSRRYEGGGYRLEIVQARSPEVALPAGLDLDTFAEMGLRLLGLEASEARRIARTTDWRTTLLLPIPSNAASFREVTVAGHSGLEITTAENRAGASQTVILWSEDAGMFGVVSDLATADVMRVAESLR